ncbi:uncharacterized protein LOC144185660 isoform X1 [Stigmatopora nigra]
MGCSKASLCHPLYLRHMNDPSLALSRLSDEQLNYISHIESDAPTNQLNVHGFSRRSFHPFQLATFALKRWWKHCSEKKRTRSQRFLRPRFFLTTSSGMPSALPVTDNRAHARRAYKDLGSDGSPPLSRPSRVALRAAILRDAAEIVKMADYKDEDDNSVCTVDKKDPFYSTLEYLFFCILNTFSIACLK